MLLNNQIWKQHWCLDPKIKIHVGRCRAHALVVWPLGQILQLLQPPEGRLERRGRLFVSTGHGRRDHLSQSRRFQSCLHSSHGSRLILERPGRWSYGFL